MAAAAAAMLLLPAFSQTTPSNPSSGSGTTSSTRTTLPTGSSPTGTNNTTTPGLSPGSQTLRVSGRVMVDDGTPPSSSATIQRVCNGNPHAEGYTDNQGYFSVLLGQNADVIADASETPSTPARNSLPFPSVALPSPSSSTTGIGRGLGLDNRLANCDLRAQLGGYTSKTINLTARTPMDNPDVGVILLHRMGTPETATTVTATTLTASKEARKALQKGLELAKKNKPEEAIASLKEAVNVDPEFAFAWCELGKLQLEHDHIPDAHESFEAAVKAEPRWPEPYLHLALMGVKAHDWREVVETTDRVLHLSSWEYPGAYFFNAAANFNLRHMDVAEKSALLAERLDVQHDFPQVEQLLGTIYADRQRYADAAEKFRAYLMMAPKADDAPSTRQQLAAMEKLAAESSQTAKKSPQQ